MKLFSKSRKIIHTGNLAAVVLSLLGKDLRIIHVGAHSAEELVLYSSYGVNDVFWVEPMADRVDFLKSKVSHDRIIPYAVWSKKTILKLHVNPNSVSSSLFQVEKNNPFNMKETVVSESVQTVTLDSILDEITPNDGKNLLIVLDVQGSELEGLKGLSQIRRSNLLGIIVEVSEIPIYVGAAKANDVRAYLKRIGFYRIMSQVYNPTRHGDELFINSNSAIKLNIKMKLYFIGILQKVMHLVYLIRRNTGRPQ
jgi:FkbM family methyltransferase